MNYKKVVEIAAMLFLFVAYFLISNVAAWLIVLSIQEVNRTLYISAFLGVATLYLILHLLINNGLRKSKKKYVVALIFCSLLDLLYFITLFLTPDYWLKVYLGLWVFLLRTASIGSVVRK